MVDKKKDIEEYEDEEEQKEETLATPGVIDKYQAAGKVANLVLERVIAKCVAGANIVEVCQFGDAEIDKELSKVYNKKRIEKGIAFPTCISPNDICGHFSPLATEPLHIKSGDVLKIDLGVHIDGYIALVAHTIVVQADPNVPVEGRAADVILAAHYAAQAALRFLRPGSKNSEASEIIGKVCEAYKCNPLEGVLSHELKKHLIDGNACIINKETFEQKVEEHEFQVNEVFALDIIVSTGEGKPKESEFRTTVYKRAIEKAYNLKSKSARAFYNELINKYPSLCFSIRSFEDEITAKLGVKECLEHELLNPYPVLLDKSGELVAHFKYTVMILSGGTITITGLPVDANKYKTENKIVDESVLTIINTSMSKQSQKSLKKKQKKEQSAEGEKK